MIITIALLIIGIMVLAGGLYYLIKEKHDKESRGIYTVTTVISAVIVIGAVIKIFIGIM